MGVLKSFDDFYKAIVAFKTQNPKLNFTFLEKENLDTLNSIAGQLDSIDANVSLDSHQVVTARKKYEQARHEGQLPSDLKEIRRVADFLLREHHLVNYKKLIKGFNHPNAEDSFFKKLKKRVEHNEQKLAEINEIESKWLKNNVYPALDANLIPKVEELLKKIEQDYLSFVAAPVERGTYLANALNYTGSSALINYMSLLTPQQRTQLESLMTECRELIKNERHRLCETILARLEVIPRRDLLATLEENDREFIYDDVVHATFAKLEKYGASKKYYQDQLPQPRQTLNSPLLRDLFEYLVTYGTSNQKRRYSEIMNKGFSETAVDEPEEFEPSRPKQSHAEKIESPQLVRIEHEKAMPVLPLEKAFPLIKERGLKCFSAERFKDHAELFADFQQRALLHHEASGSTGFTLDKIFEFSYFETLATYIPKKADALFPKDYQSQTKEEFINYAYGKLTKKIEDQAFSDQDLEESITQLKHDKEAKLEGFIDLYAQPFEEAKLDAAQITSFKKTAKEDVQANDDWWTWNVEKTAHVIESNKDFIILRNKLLELLAKEKTRIENPKGISNWFMSTTKTGEKIIALTDAGVIIRKVQSVDQLRVQAYALLDNVKFTQNRGVFSFFGKSKSEKDLRKFLKDEVAEAGYKR